MNYVDTLVTSIARTNRTENMRQEWQSIISRQYTIPRYGIQNSNMQGPKGKLTIVQLPK